MAAVLPALDLLEAVVRPFTPADLPYVNKSYRESYAAFCEGAEGKLERQARRDLADARIADGLARDIFSIACDPVAQDQILGWAWIRQPSFLVYVYVKQLYRRQGLAHLLLAPLAACHVVHCLHWTRDFSLFAERRAGFVKVMP